MGRDVSYYLPAPSRPEPRSPGHTAPRSAGWRGGLPASAFGPGCRFSCPTPRGGGDTPFP